MSTPVKVEAALKRAELRVEVDRSGERLGYKIRQATMQKVPYVIVVGQKEVESNTINVRVRDGEDVGETTVEAWVGQLPPVSVPQLAASLAKSEADQAAQ